MSINNQSEKSIEQTLEDICDKYAERMKEIQTELADIFSIDEFNLVNENMKTVSKLHYWISKNAIEKRILLKIKRKRDSIYSELFYEYRTGKKGAITLTNDGINSFINREPSYQKWDTLVNEQTILVEYIEQICWALKQTKMAALRNIQESKKIEGS